MYKITIRKIDGSNFDNGQDKIVYKSSSKAMVRMKHLSMPVLRRILKALDREKELNDIWAISEQSVIDFLGCYETIEKIDGRRTRLCYLDISHVAWMVLGDKLNR